MSPIEKARALLAQVTPLKADCGRLCGAACCQGEGDVPTGMILYPGEADLYPPDLDWAQITPNVQPMSGQPGQLLVCRGHCPRDQRPLACWVFPLIPRLEGQGFRLALDVRAWPVCPLMPSGIQGLDPAFVHAAQEAFALLWADERCRVFLAGLDRLLQQYESF